MHTTRFEKNILRLKFAQQKSDEILKFDVCIHTEEDTDVKSWSSDLNDNISLILS